MVVDDDAFIQYPWKLFRFSLGDFERYNIEEDPSEQRNVGEREAQAKRGEQMLAVLEAKPRGEPVGVPIWQIMWDMDFFGGEEDRPPWMEIVQ